MEYTKPELNALADALSAIRGQKNDPTKDESIEFPRVGTTAAYESDE